MTPRFPKESARLSLLVGVMVAAFAQPALAAKAKKPVAAPAATASEPAAPAARPASDTKDPQKFIGLLYERLNQLSQAAPTLDALHASIGKELTGVVDYEEMGRLTLASRWPQQTSAEQQEFVRLLAGMVLNTYVKRFKPGNAVDLKWDGPPRTLSQGRVQVPTVLTVKKTSADVHYAMLTKPTGWWVYDIVIDDASQVQTYRTSFKKILDKEGWPGLMTRMRKAAQKKVG